MNHTGPDQNPAPNGQAGLPTLLQPRQTVTVATPMLRAGSTTTDRSSGTAENSVSSTVRVFDDPEAAQDAPRPDERTLRPLHNTAHAGSKAVAADAQAGASATLPRSVLLVDDNRDASSSLAELLRMMGHDVVVAVDGPESLSLVDAGHTFDVALLDIGLPGMSGHELAQLLRQRFAQPTLRLVALTGFGIAPDIARHNGFDDYFVKPVDIDALIASICMAGRPAA